MTDTQTRQSPLLLYLSLFTGLLGMQMFMYSLIIFTNRFTGSSAVTGVVFYCVALPQLLTSFYAGTVIDRRSRKGILLLFTTLFALITAVLGLLAQFAFPRPLADGSVANVVGTDMIILLCVVSLAIGVTLTFLIPTRFAVLGDFFPDEDVGKATVMVNVMLLVSFGGAPFVSGAIKDVTSWHNLFYIIAGLTFLANPLLFLVRLNPAQSQVTMNAWQNFKEGLNYIRNHRLALQLIVMVFIIMFVVGPIQVVFPRFARVSLGLIEELPRGLYMGALGLGLLLGGISAAFFNNRRSRGLVVIYLAIYVGAIIYFVPFIFNTGISATLLVIVGLCGGIASSLLPAALQSIITNEFRGRVMSIYSLVFQGTTATTGLITGLIASKAGLGPAIQISGVVVIALTAIAFFTLTSVRNYD